MHDPVPGSSRCGKPRVFPRGDTCTHRRDAGHPRAGGWVRSTEDLHAPREVGPPSPPDVLPVPFLARWRTELAGLRPDVHIPVSGP